MKRSFPSLIFTILAASATVCVFFFVKRHMNKDFKIGSYNCSSETGSMKSYWSGWTYIPPCAPYEERVKQAIYLNRRELDKEWFPKDYTKPEDEEYKCEIEFPHWNGRVVSLCWVGHGLWKLAFKIVRRNCNFKVVKWQALNAPRSILSVSV
ncbi:hypothetical protein L596_010714 [Steinernema carpocapsae]|uniref:Uncharacterized protein n=1 Tax=Steinernema carpocapsae TaxID=34508 RepID=A0A4U5PJS2_STECR|nr:hypothetical protein L596_010714 [Steinernema carpocapsae]